MSPLPGIGMRPCAVRLILTLAAASLLLAAGCGGGHPNVAGPPPGGSFSKSNLNGTYVFSFVGTDITNGNSSSFAVAGVLAANGSGSFTSGTIDINDPALEVALGVNQPLLSQGVTGSYNITSDGRGSGTITITGIAVKFGLDFALMNSSHGLITRFDNTGSGSGTLDRMASGVTQAGLQGSYAFGFSGVDSGNNPLSTVGDFTLDAMGNVTAGLQDFNDNGNSSNLQALPLISASTVTVGSTPGKAQLTTSVAAFGTLNFDIWVVDSTHLKFIETDTTAILAGDAFVSTGHTSFPSGSLVITMSGIDTNALPFAAGGLLTSDGSSQITSGLQDVNDEGLVTQAPSVTGNFMSVGGRPQLTLDGIFNGNIVNGTLLSGNYMFAAYPYNGGVQLLEIDNAGVTGGVAYVQTATSIASPQGYALNLSGANGSTGNLIEVDEIAEFTASNGTMSGLYDVNNEGVLASDLSLGGGASYSVASNGRGTASFPKLQTNNNTLISALNFTFYVVDSSTAVFLETDSSQISLGSFQLQNAGQALPAQITHFNMVRWQPHAGTGWRQLEK